MRGGDGWYVGSKIAQYRVHDDSNTSRDGVDVHYTYEASCELVVPAYAANRKHDLVRRFSHVAVTRYLRANERARAWDCYWSPAWTWRNRLSRRGLACLGMLCSPRYFWAWALR